MRIAVACRGLAIAPQFTLCTNYTCYTIEHGRIRDSRNIPALDQPLDALPGFLHALEADALITGTIDQNLVQLFEDNGIAVFPEASGDPLAAVQRQLTSV